MTLKVRVEKRLQVVTKISIDSSISRADSWQHPPSIVSVVMIPPLARFSTECRKTKTNHKGHRQYNEPIKNRSNSSFVRCRCRRRQFLSFFSALLVIF